MVFLTNSKKWPVLREDKQTDKPLITRLPDRSLVNSDCRWNLTKWSKSSPLPDPPPRPTSGMGEEILLEGKRLTEWCCSVTAVTFPETGRPDYNSHYPFPPPAFPPLCPPPSLWSSHFHSAWILSSCTLFSFISS